MGVTWRTQDLTYSEKVPSTVKPEYLPLAQTIASCQSTEAFLRCIMILTLLETLPAVLAVEARVGEPLDTDAVTDLDLLVLRVLTDGYDDTDTLAYTSGSSSLGSASEYTRTS